MDFSFDKSLDEDFVFKDDLFGSRFPKSSSEIMDNNWSSDDLLSSIFPADFFNHDFDNMNNLDSHIKMEAEDYELTSPFLPEPLLSPESNVISSNSSDSGLSSDNLEIEMSPTRESTNPPTPNTTVIDRRCKRLPVANTYLNATQPPQKKLCSDAQPPKVIVQKVPQMITIQNSMKTNFPVTLRAQIQQHSETQSPKLQNINCTTANEVKIVKLSPQVFTASNNKPVTIQVRNSSSGAKIQAKPGTLFLNKTKLSEMKKVVRMPNSNPRSILIPVTLQEVKDMKTFKVVNSTAIRSAAVRPNVATVEPKQRLPITHVEKAKVFKTIDIKKDEKDDSFLDNSSDSESIIIEDNYELDDYSIDSDAPHPKLVLTTEEKRLLGKEGITLPSHYPLTKHEERELKRIRRKIRNKISAQDSRKRKKEYVDGLEERVKQCTAENQTLIKKLKQLQNQNQNLISQMKKLQTLLTKGTNKTTQPTTCLMVLLLSLALVAAPNLRLGQNPKEGDLEEAVQETILQNRRNLLFNNKDQNIDTFEEEVNMSDIASAVEFGNDRETKTLSEPKFKKTKLLTSGIIDDDVDEDNWYSARKYFNVNSFSLDNDDHIQTSGFNIKADNKIHSLLDNDLWSDKEIADMITSPINSFYEMDVDRVSPGIYSGSTEATVIDVTTPNIHSNQINVKHNSSDMRPIKRF